MAEFKEVYIVIDKARYDDEIDDMEFAFLSRENAENYITKAKEKRPWCKFEIDTVILGE